MKNNLEELCTNLENEVQSLIDNLSTFSLGLDINDSYSKTALYMLFTRSINSFISAELLCSNGLHVDSYNSIRIGLETGWLSIILSESNDLAFQWLTLVPSDRKMDDAEKKYRSTFGSVKWIRKTISTDNEDKKQRDNIYGILCTKSHANVASTFYIAGPTGDVGNLYLYPPGTLQDLDHKYKNLKGIQFCLQYLLFDIQKHLNVDFGVHWNYDHFKLFEIAGVGYPDGKGGVEVFSEKVNSMYQAVILKDFKEKRWL